jgi:NADPH-dependent 2,4-dienoyl-CoA reductase/sulfur reductase-like enzyme
MEIEKHDLLIIGGGPAGLAAAIAARNEGCNDIVLVERDRILGGILNQCIHDGFGLHTFKEALSGPEYAARYIDKVRKMDIMVMEKTIVLSLSKNKTLRLSREGEIKEVQAKAVVLAMGCRERTRGALSIPGDRPAGVYTAGMVQNLVNLENMMPGQNICILGSGDIGLIMARRMTLEGAKVKAVFEVMPYSSGLQRNIRQCLNDYGIPLYLNTTVTDINGPTGRLEGVTVAKVDNKRRPIAGTEKYFECDSLLLSVGLIPENELSREANIPIDKITQGAIVDEKCMTQIPGVFACGNVLHVHDLVDFVSIEASKAGVNAAKYVAGKMEVVSNHEVSVTPGNGVRYIVPQKIKSGKDISLAFRVILPSHNSTIEVICDGNVIKAEKHMHLHPAEMVWVKLGNINITNMDKLEVRVK